MVKRTPVSVEPVRDTVELLAQAARDANRRADCQAHAVKRGARRSRTVADIAAAAVELPGQFALFDTGPGE